MNSWNFNRLDFERFGQGRLVQLAGSHPNEVMPCLGEANRSPEASWHFQVDKFSRLVNALPAAVVQNWLDQVGTAGARGLARHLQPPHPDREGHPIVPPLTAFVLDCFADDEQVFEEFCAGTHSGQIYEGDMAAQHKREAEVGRRFLAHPLRRVRDWALAEIASARGKVAVWRPFDEEMAPP